MNIFLKVDNFYPSFTKGESWTISLLFGVSSSTGGDLEWVIFKEQAGIQEFCPNLGKGLAR